MRWWRGLLSYQITHSKKMLISSFISQLKTKLLVCQFYCLFWGTCDGEMKYLMNMASGRRTLRNAFPFFLYTLIVVHCTVLSSQQD